MASRAPILLLLVACCSVVGLALARGVTTVSTDTELINAIDAAQPGDIIEIAASTTITLTDVGKIRCDVAGTPEAPITVRGAANSLIEMDSTGTVLEGFLVSQPYWLFINVTIDGICTNDDHCEHAWHVVGDSDFFLMRGCQATNFNAQLKVNIGNGEFPDDCLIEQSSFYDTRARQTSNPVTKLNIDGGERWVVRQNYIGDGQKALGNTISYQAFMKSNGADGIFEQNVVVCEGGMSPHFGGTRVGLSFGGGGTSPDSVCGQGTCTPEHRNGIMRNNVILHCNDVGIYLNEATNTRLMNNLLYDTTGIDVRFAESTATISNNILAGGDISDRDMGSHTASTNWLTDVATIDATFAMDPFDSTFLDLLGANQGQFVAQGTDVSPVVTVDFCGTPRTPPYDIGPLQGGAACNPWQAFGAGAEATSGGEGDGDGDGDSASSLPMGWMDGSPIV